MKLIFSFLYIIFQLSVRAHHYSTLFLASDVNTYLVNDSGIEDAIQWCKATNISKVYIESYRGGVTVPVNILKHAQQMFRDAGFLVSGCVCTTNVGKPSTGWDRVSCYTNMTTQEQIKSIFEYAAGVFDEIIIDDFYFTDCQCSQCNASLDAQTITVGTHVHHFDNTSDPSCGGDEECMWKDMRRALLSEVSHWNVLDAAKRVNPQVKIIIKYPNWYDAYQDKGYDTIVETNEFDKIWVGTESRDYNDTRWGGIPQYFGFFNMRWLGGIGGDKCGGGWFDWLGTSPSTYIEQARVTMLGGAKESLLFCYSGLLSEGGSLDVLALREVQDEISSVAKEVQTRDIVGISAYKPPNSHGGCVQDPSKSGHTCKGETHIFDFVGMLGFPLKPCHTFPLNSSAAFFSLHALKDPSISFLLQNYVDSGKPTLLTDGLMAKLNTTIHLDKPNVYVLPVKKNPRELLYNPPPNLSDLRSNMIGALGWQLNQAPLNVSLFPFSDGSWVMTNFNDEIAEVKLQGVDIKIPSRGWSYHWQ